MTSETDAEFLDRLEATQRYNPSYRTLDSDRLFALARRGAAAERLRVENIQVQAALGYAICAEDERHIIPSNPFKCGVCDARARAKKDAPA